MQLVYKNNNLKKRYTLIFTGLFLLFTIFIFRVYADADLVNDLKDKIDAKSADIKKLEEEIKIYEKSLNKTAEQAKSLQNELQTLTLAKKKLETELKLTNKNLDRTTETIGHISDKISVTEESIDAKRNAMSQLIKNVRLIENVSLIQIFLSSENINEVSGYIEQSEKLNESITKVIDDLRDLDQRLSQQKSEQEGKKTELKKLQSELSGQTKAVADTAKIKDKLLVDTKNQESNYKKILEEKVRQREEFEKELFKFESELKIAIDPSKLPSKKGGALSWPLESIYITQQFGRTGVSGRLYASGTHNGVDFRATMGTKVMTSLSGAVTATGNTDLKKGCYSYGKWILIKHPNGLSTLYGHLSSISVSPGDTVTTGDVIGYSGSTGYVTGPHLHFTVLATEGIRVMTIPTATPCNGVTIPIGTPQAFLDPLLYLPQ
jgi:murein DD-endopeptidase MepM/ murein hydrolase activator NlpD